MHRVTNADAETQLGDCEECGSGVSLRPHRRKARPGKVEWRCRRAIRLGPRQGRPWAKRDAHGLTLDEARAYKAGKVCEVCGSAENLRVDHCHREGQLRGVLCHNCNTGIGMLGDDVERLEAAIAYLQRSH